MRVVEEKQKNKIKRGQKQTKMKEREQQTKRVVLGGKGMKYRDRESVREKQKNESGRRKNKRMKYRERETDKLGEIE